MAPDTDADASANSPAAQTPGSDSPPAAASAPAGTGRSLWGEPIRRILLVALGLFAVAAAIVMPAATRVHGMSVFDEATHADYAYQVAHGHIPYRGSILAPAIRAEIVCRGAARVPATVFPHCGETQPALSLFGGGAQDYNFSHPPVYYALTGVFARVGNFLAGGHHFITFARLAGVLWLFAAMLVMYVALRRFRVRWPLAVCGAALLALTPAIFYQEATVNNDAPAALASSLAVLTLARLLIDGKLGWKLPALLALLAASTKIINALPFLAGAVLLVVLAARAWHIDRQRARALLGVAIGIIGGVLVVYVGWTYLQQHRGDPHWKSPIDTISSQKVHGLPFDELFSTTFASDNLLSSGYLPSPLANEWIAVLLRLWGPLSIAGLGMLLALNERWSPRFTFAAVTVLGVLSFPLVVELQVYVNAGKYFPAVIPRYGLSYIPMLIAGMALAADSRRLDKWMIGFATACLAIGLYTVFIT